MIDPKEFEINYDLQKMFAAGLILNVPLYQVDFHTSPGKPPVQQQFFFYEGKWRNTESRSQFGAIIFDEHEIRSTVFVTG